MEFRQLGTLPLQLSKIGYGTARIGDLNRLQDCEAVLNTAWASGIRYFDTAPGYGLGLSERRLGDFLRTKDRSSYVLSTKVGKILSPVRGQPAGVMPFELTYDYTYDGVMRSFEFSMARLGLLRAANFDSNKPLIFVETAVNVDSIFTDFRNPSSLLESFG